MTSSSTRSSATGHDVGLGAAANETTADAHPHVDARRLGGSHGLTVTLAASRCRLGGWEPPHEGAHYGLALPQSGAFRRRTDGIEHFVDRNMGFFRSCGEVSEVAHVDDRPHAGTIVDVVADTAAGEAIAEVDAHGPFLVSPSIAVAHRMLLASLSAPDVDELDVDVRAHELISACIAQPRPSFTARTEGTPNTARRRLALAVCEQLHGSTQTSLNELAAAVHYSPFHLSRVFREVVGIPMSTYRQRLRVQEVLSRLHAGETRLQDLALSVGFSDHAHMTRTVVALAGDTPTGVRRRLRALTDRRHPKNDTNRMEGG